MANKKHLRYFSIDNDWMDCVITVNEEDVERAKEVIMTAMNEWWDFLGDEGYCYGDAIEEALTDSEILYNIRYHACDTDNLDVDWEEYEKEWEDSIPEDCESLNALM